MPNILPAQVQQDTDDALVQAGKNERSRTLAKLYDELAGRHPCLCRGAHDSDRECCPKAIWQQAARMAQQMIDE